MLAPDALLQQFLAKFDLNREEASQLAQMLHVRVFEKGTALVKAGEISRKCYFVLQGCLRRYVLREGEEKTTHFYTEEQAATLFTSLSNQTPAEDFLVCVEESVLLVGEMGEDAAMYQRFPKLEGIVRQMMMQDFGKAQDDWRLFITSSPEERYQHLQQTRPDLLQRVPQHQLASYIGVTPESLSRIRKRLAKHR